MTTVCLFADISGFTNVSEACAKKGVRGNEELAFCINRYMEGMVKNLGKYGGDIIKFVGDAMIVMWPPEPTTFQSSAESASLTVRKAIQCALDIQKDMNNFKVIAGVSSLSVKVTNFNLTNFVDRYRIRVMRTTLRWRRIWKSRIFHSWAGFDLRFEI